MQPFAIRNFNALPHAVAGVLPVIAAMLFYVPCAAQPVNDSTHSLADSTSIAMNVVKRARPDVVTTFEEFNMPIEMVIRFTQLTPKDMLLFRDEFQVMRDGVYGQEMDMIKIWYLDDHMVGYVIETPIERGDGAPITKWKFDIPITWCCRPSIEGHVEHCAASLAEVKLDENSFKCIGWHIKMPPPLPPEPKYKLQKIKKKKKGKDDSVLKTDDTQQKVEGTDTKKKKKKKGDQKVGFQEGN